MPPGSRSSRRPRAEVGTQRETSGSRSAEAPPDRETVVLQEAIVTEPSSGPAQPAGMEAEDRTAAPRFRIFIIDTNWDSPAHKVLQENFSLIPFRGAERRGNLDVRLDDWNHPCGSNH